MTTDSPALLSALYFYPRGGSAHAARAISAELGRNGFDVTLLAGSRTDLGSHADATRFFDRAGLVPVDFTDALASACPVRHDGGPGTAPMQGSYEERPGADDPVFAAIDDDTYELHVAAWARELRGAGADDADLLYLHHLTPLNEAASRFFGETPVIGHIHGSELLMLERIVAGAPASWVHAERWAARLHDWAGACDRLIVNSPEGLKRAARVLDLDPERFVLIPNGFDPGFAPAEIDRRAHWTEHLVARPQGWRPGDAPGSVTYTNAEIEVLEGATTLLYCGRFTEVKRLPCLLEAYADALPDFLLPTALVLLGGFPGEWEGEHPLETIGRLGLEDVFLAGWHAQSALPEFLAAADVMVHPSVREQFGQALVEAMACGVPPIAVDRGGPSTIVDAGRTGWLVEPDDRAALAAAMLEAVNDPAECRARGKSAREDALRRYTWGQIGASLGGELREIHAGTRARQSILSIR
ncbi:MAG: glycosyltransferase family 4 protein [Solirubrobacterales bacterium]